MPLLWLGRTADWLELYAHELVDGCEGGAASAGRERGCFFERGRVQAHGGSRPYFTAGSSSIGLGDVLGRLVEEILAKREENSVFYLLRFLRFCA